MSTTVSLRWAVFVVVFILIEEQRKLNWETFVVMINGTNIWAWRKVYYSDAIAELCSILIIKKNSAFILQWFNFLYHIYIPNILYYILSLWHCNYLHTCLPHCRIRFSRQYVLLFIPVTSTTLPGIWNTLIAERSSVERRKEGF